MNAPSRKGKQKQELNGKNNNECQGNITKKKNKKKKKPFMRKKKIGNMFWTLNKILRCVKVEAAWGKTNFRLIIQTDLFGKLKP